MAPSVQPPKPDATSAPNGPAAAASPNAPAVKPDTTPAAAAPVFGAGLVAPRPSNGGASDGGQAPEKAPEAAKQPEPAPRPKPAVDLAAHLEEALLGPAEATPAASKPVETPKLFEAPKTPEPAKSDAAPKPAVTPKVEEKPEATKAPEVPAKPEPSTASDGLKAVAPEPRQAAANDQNADDSDKPDSGAQDGPVTIDTIEEEMAKLLNEIGGKDKK